MSITSLPCCRIDLVRIVGDQRRGAPEPSALAIGARSVRKFVGDLLRVVRLGELARVFAQRLALTREILGVPRRTDVYAVTGNADFEFQYASNIAEICGTTGPIAITSRSRKWT